MPVETYTTKFGADIAPLQRATKIIYDQFGRVHKQIDVTSKSLKRHRTEQEKLIRSQASLARAQARSLRADAALKESRLKATIATKQATRATREYSSTSREMRLVTTGIHRELGKLRNTLLLVAFAYHTVQRFVLRNLEAHFKFEKSLKNIEVMISEHAGPIMRNFRVQIEELSVTYGRSADILTQAMFDVFSATGKAALSQQILAAATKLSVAGGAELADTTSGLVTLMEAYSKHLRGAEDAAALLFVAQVKARATVGQLAAEVGKFLPLSDKLKISVEESFAVFSKLTVGLGDVSEAATAMRGILTALFKPTKELQKYSKEWYKTTIQVAIQQHGLLDVLKRIGEVDAATLGQLIRRVRALTGVAVVTKDLNKVMRDAIDFTDRETILQEALNKQLETGEEKVNRLKEAWNLFGRSIGKLLAERGTLGLMAKFLEKMAKGIIVLTETEEIRRRALKKLTDEQREMVKLSESWLSSMPGAIIFQKKMTQAREVYALAIRLVIKEMERERKEIELAKRAEEEAHKIREIIMISHLTWLDKLGIKFREIFKDIDEGAKKTAKAMSRSFSDLFFDVMTRQFKGLEHYARAFGQTMIRMITDYLAKLAVAFAFFKLLGIPIPAGYPGHVAHQGGVVRGGRIQRYQQGGVVPALLESGEGVVSRRGMAALGAGNLARLNRGEEIGGDTYMYNINAIDAASFREQLSQNADIFEAQSADAIIKNRALRGIAKIYG